MIQTRVFSWRVALLTAIVLGGFAGPGLAQTVVTEPTIARDLPTANGLPGVFLEGQIVTVAVPPDLAAPPVRWRALDDRDESVAGGDIRGAVGAIDAGPLGIGWYRIEFLDAEGTVLDRTTAAVLARLAAPIPQDSPICIDSATAWFAPDDPDKQERFAQLAALAGVNWIRDRMRWRQIQPAPDRFEPVTAYDSAADLQVRHGLKILQVFHDTPPWAVAPGESRGRYARDLRHVYRFCKAMAQRYKGRVLAWEPWNEANVSTFGSHTADEMCTYQKAAYLGFKAGDPDLVVGWNVSTATPTALHTNVVLQNETWPYFDTYNIHTYDWPDSYERLWKPVHGAACGRPIWVTESDRGITYETGAPHFDLSHRGALQKAEFMAQSYACSLFAGAERHFHFILGDYHETSNKVQFGLLRPDQTPRPGYVALAAVGRFLAGARCLGRWTDPARPHAHVYAFAAKPDGRPRDVLVAWAEKPGDWDQRGKTVVDWALPAGMRVEDVYDYLGRSLGGAVPKALRSKPVFVLLTSGDAERLPLEKPERSTFREGRTCPIVMQLDLPAETSVNVKQIPWASDFEHQVTAGREIELPLRAYNFGAAPARGRIVVEHVPASWTLTPNAWDVTLDPMTRQTLSCQFTMPESESDKSADHWIRLRGDFGPLGQSVLAFRLISAPGEGYEGPVPPTGL